jgi:hypothetical protein
VDVLDVTPRTVNADLCDVVVSVASPFDLHPATTRRGVVDTVVEAFDDAVPEFENPTKNPGVPVS